MSNLSGWDLMILAIAVYIAMVTLVRLMRRRRDEEVARLRVQVAVQLRRKRAAERQERKQQARGQAARAGAKAGTSRNKPT